MKNTLLFALLITFLVAPIVAGAHVANTTNLQDSGFVMMRQIEDQALDDNTHEEMEGLMVKMMSGDLSQDEIDRILELMNQYPGPGSMMIGRMMGMSGSDFNSFNHNSMMGYGFSGFGGWIVMIIFWALVIVGIVALIKYVSGNGAKSGNTDKKALDILKERYAKGEIDKEEFESKKKDIEK